MKEKTTKRATRRLAASLAIGAALATSSAWAARNWTGSTDGDFSNSGNWNGSTGRRYFKNGNLTENKTDIIYLSRNVSESSHTGLCFYDVPDRGYWRFNGQNQYTFDNSGNTSNYDQDLICIGYNGYDSSARFYAITLKTRHLTIGGDASSGGGVAKYDMTGHLILDDLNNDANGYLGPVNITTTLTCDFYKGDLYATNANITCQGNMSLYNFTAEKTGGDWCVGNLAMNTADGTTAVFYNRGGNLVVTNDLTVQNRGSGEFYMEGGHVIVSNIVRFGEWIVPANGIANLYLNGGVFEAKTFRFHNSNGPNGYVVLNGGTYKAMADGSVAATDGRLGAVARLYFKVGTRGGTIDTAGHDVIFPLRLLQDGSSTGGLCVKGGGSLTLENANVTYTGKTCIEAGTMLVVSNSTVKSNILSHGIELVGAPTLNTEYTVFRCNDDLDAETDLANVTCPVAESFTPSIGTDGKSIVVTVTALKSGNVWTGAKDNNLSDSANWLGGNVPTSGNAEIYCPVATTLTVGDTFSPDTITIPDASSVVTIGAGDLHVNTLTNASKLAIGAGASLEVDGDLVTIPYYRVSRTILYSNDGTVVVHGKVIGVDNGNEGKIYEYQTTSANTKPIRTSGLVYEGHKNRMYFHPGGSASGTIGKWVIGKDGLSFNGLGSVDYSCFWAYNAEITFGSSANWTLENSMGNSTSYGDLKVSNGASVTLDTSDYSNPTVPRTITLEGRLCALNIGMSKSACVIDGCGTVIVDTKDMSSVTGIADPLKHTCITNSILQVKSGATLQVNAGKKITGANGRIALDAGATLALVSGGTDDFTTRIEPAVTLPTEGVATIRIDGARLRGGDHTIATVASGTTANVTLDPASTALVGRKGSLRVDGSNLVLNIEPTGAMVIVF